MEKNNFLKANRIENTIQKLGFRIKDRFPNSSLGKTCHDFFVFAKENNKNIDWINKPNILIRAISYSAILLALSGICYSLSMLKFDMKNNVSELSAFLEASINNIVLIGAAFYFLFNVENRIKRNRAIKMLNEIKNYAHVVDMHQLTKDPMLIGTGAPRTENSPERIYDEFQLKRYLEYCCEFLSLVGKVAALYSQNFSDGEVERTSNEIEMLCSNLSSKIWQKLIILNFNSQAKPEEKEAEINE